MIGERGPKGTRHLPEYCGGCYRGRIDTCCWLCVVRIIVSHLFGFLRIRTKRAIESHRLIGERVEIPVIRRADGDERVEHLTGEITDVFDLDDEPNVFAVRLENGERLALSVEHVT